MTMRIIIIPLQPPKAVGPVGPLLPGTDPYATCPAMVASFWPSESSGRRSGAQPFSAPGTLPPSLTHGMPCSQEASGLLGADCGMQETRWTSPNSSLLVCYKTYPNKRRDKGEF